MTLPAGYMMLPLRSSTTPPATHTNCYILGHDDALIVDPGSSFPGEQARLLRAIWRLRGSGGRVQAVLLTHHHLDHAAGAAALAAGLDVPVAAHAATFDRLPRLTAGPAPRACIDEGHEFSVGDRTELQVLHTPGHAPGHICLLDPHRRILVAGDMISGAGTILIDPPDGDMGVYLSSLERLTSLRPGIILPAHGPPLTRGSAALGDLIEHRRWREQRVLRALTAAPRELPAVALDAYDDLSLLLLPLAIRSTLAHLLELRRVGKAMRNDGGRWLAVGTGHRANSS